MVWSGNRVEALNGPPWLIRAKLPSDGSVNGGVEIGEFEKFMSVTERERDAQRAIRSVVQRAAALYCDGVTAKVVGECAAGVDCYNTPYEIVVEQWPSGTAPSYPLEDFMEPIIETLKESELLTISSPTKATLSITDTSSGVTATVHFTNSMSSSRTFALGIRNRLRRHPNGIRFTKVILAVLRQMKLVNESGHLSPQVVCMMSLAFMDAKAGAEGEEKDLLWLLREFFQFYVQFDFGAMSITDTGCCPKQHKADQLSATASFATVQGEGTSSENLAASTTKLQPITAMFKYISLSIAKWDAGASLSRGRSLLFNILAHKELWARYYQLEGIEPPQKQKPKGTQPAIEKNLPPPQASSAPPTVVPKLAMAAAKTTPVEDAQNSIPSAGGYFEA